MTQFPPLPPWNLHQLHLIVIKVKEKRSANLMGAWIARQLSFLQAPQEIFPRTVQQQLSGIVWDFCDFIFFFLWLCGVCWIVKFYFSLNAAIEMFPTNRSDDTRSTKIVIIKTTARHFLLFLFMYLFWALFGPVRWTIFFCFKISGSDNGRMDFGFLKNPNMFN